MALSMYLLCRYDVNPLIWRFSKHFFLEKNEIMDILDKMCTARVQKREMFFRGEFCTADKSTPKGPN